MFISSNPTITEMQSRPDRTMMFYLSLLGFFAIFSTTISKNPVLPLYVQAIGAGDTVIGPGPVYYSQRQPTRTIRSLTRIIRNPSAGSSCPFTGFYFQSPEKSGYRYKAEKAALFRLSIQ